MPPAPEREKLPNPLRRLLHKSLGVSCAVTSPVTERLRPNGGEGCRRPATAIPRPGPDPNSAAAHSPVAPPETQAAAPAYAPGPACEPCSPADAAPSQPWPLGTRRLRE